MGGKMIGIYCITNTINGKKYIGQSWDIEKRFKQHVFNPPNTHIKNALQKYGINSFIFEAIFQLKNGPFTQKYLNRFENYYISRFDTTNNMYGYNKRDGGSNGKLSEEVKLKIAQTHMGMVASEESKRKNSASKLGKKTGPCSEKRKLAISQANTGRVKTEEEKAKISKSLAGRKTGPCSEARRKAISEAKKGKNANPSAPRNNKGQYVKSQP